MTDCRDNQGISVHGLPWISPSQSSDNPIYYIQYAHARVTSVMHQMQDKSVQWDRPAGEQNLDRLGESHEGALMACCRK